MNVGQGQCLVLQIGDYTALIDCGGSYPEDAGEQAARFLHGAGVTRADALIVTHYDDDHAGGAAQFLERVKVDSIYLPPVKGTDETASAIAQFARPHYVTEMVEICLPEGVLTILPPVSQENPNNSGVCVLATAEEYDILITGDLDSLSEMRLMTLWKLPDVDLLVAGHHGAKTSTSQPLLDMVRPETVVISVGENNRYSHPHEETLQRLADIGAQVYRTDLSGTLYFHP